MSLAIRQATPASDESTADDGTGHDDLIHPMIPKCLSFCRRCSFTKEKQLRPERHWERWQTIPSFTFEGRAFEQDVELLSQSAERNWKITACLKEQGTRQKSRES